MNKGKIVRAANESGKQPDELLIELFDKHGNMADVARELRVTMSSVSNALARSGLKCKTVVVPRYPGGKAA